MIKRTLSEFDGNYFSELRNCVVLYGNASKKVRYLEQDVKALYGEIVRLRSALEQIADPVYFLERNMPNEGSKIEEYQQKSESADYLKSLALEALGEKFPKISREED